MDGRGRALDNVFIERLWRSIKYEDIYLRGYEDGLCLHQGLERWFDHYNNHRPHQALDYATPWEWHFTAQKYGATIPTWIDDEELKI
jgi:putative transposase